MKKGRWLTIGLAALAAAPLLYVLSLGPACWLTAQRVGSGIVEPSSAMIVYWPLGSLATNTDSRSGQCLRWWMAVGVMRGYSVAVPTSSGGNVFIMETD
jgi:hypothetical protein